MSALLPNGIAVFYLRTSYMVDLHEQVEVELRVLDSFLEDFTSKHVGLVEAIVIR